MHDGDHVGARAARTLCLVAGSHGGCSVALMVAASLSHGAARHRTRPHLHVIRPCDRAPARSPGRPLPSPSGLQAAPRHSLLHPHFFLPRSREPKGNLQRWERWCDVDYEGAAQQDNRPGSSPCPQAACAPLAPPHCPLKRVTPPGRGDGGGDGGGPGAHQFWEGSMTVLSPVLSDSRTVASVPGM